MNGVDNAKEQMVVCKSCGGKYDAKLEKCPYCEALNLPAAEAEYMETLEDMREELDDLKTVPIQEVKTVAGRSGKYAVCVVLIGVIVAVVLAVIGSLIFRVLEKGVDTDTGDEVTREEYVWQNNTFPEWNRMYEEGEYDEVLVLMGQADEEGHLVWMWEHDEFFYMYDRIVTAKELIAVGELNQRQERLLLYEQWIIKGMHDYPADSLSEEELDILKPMAEPIMEDFENRWDFTEEEYEKMLAQFQEREGYITFDLIDEILMD